MRPEQKDDINSSLLHDSSSSSFSETEGRPLGCIDSSVLLEEAKKQVRLAGPIVAVFLLQRCIQLMSVMFVGHLGNLQLSAASVATSFVTVTGFSFVIGTANALDTLCGQAYGAKQYHMLGLYMQRSIFLLFVFSVPIAILWTYTEKILLVFGQDPDISGAAGTYNRWMIPSLFAYCLQHSEIRFLQTQSNVLPMMLSTLVCTFLHFVICWILVFRSEMGYEGAALANSISYWINVFLLAAYIKCSPKCKNTWTGFSRGAVHDLVSFTKLAVPSAVMTSLAWWSFEMLTLLAGLLPNPKVETSVLAVIINTSSSAFTIVSGLASSVSTRVSNELGAGRPQAARIAVHVVLLLALAEASCVSITLIFIRRVWGYVFSSDQVVVDSVSSIMPFLAVATFMDSIQYSLTGYCEWDPPPPIISNIEIYLKRRFEPLSEKLGFVRLGNHFIPHLYGFRTESQHMLMLSSRNLEISGVARGCGRQRDGALINFGSYYIVGVPLALVLAFGLHLRGMGLWLGITCAIFVQMVLYFFLTAFTNWEEQARKAMDRVYTAALKTEGLM